jgi:DNA-binding HxlR family transcriptional regulator
MTVATEKIAGDMSENKLCDKFVATFEILGRKWNGMIIETLLAHDVLKI